MMNMTAFAAALKTHYSKQRRARMADRKSPFYGLVKKDTKSGGDKYKQVLDYGLPGGGSADIQKAIANSTASKYKAFEGDLVDDYQIVNIQRRVIEKSSNGDQNAFFEAIKETDRGMRGAVQQASSRIFRGAGGSLGRIASGTTLSGAVATLQNRTDVYNVRIGDKHTFAAADGTGSERDSSETLTVISLNRKDGTVTYNLNLNTIASIEDTDFIFREGDFGACMTGLSDYILADRSSIPDLHGCVRSDDPDALAGILYEQNGAPLHEVLLYACARLQEFGGDPDYAFVNPSTLADLMVLLEGKVHFEKTVIKNKAGVGFKAVCITTPTGDVNLVADVFCQADRIWLLEMETWLLASAGQSPKFLDLDGMFSRSTTADAYECRIGALNNLFCSAPGRNAVIKLDSN